MAKSKSTKYVYTWGNKKADGDGSMKPLLGGKGANLAEMTRIGLPVPPGFTITTEVCTYYYAHKRTYPKELQAQMEAGIANMEKIMGTQVRFDEGMPLLVAVRSGARDSMPGMMDTILNLGLNDQRARARRRPRTMSASRGIATAASSRCMATSSSACRSAKAKIMSRLKRRHPRVQAREVSQGHRGQRTDRRRSGRNSSSASRRSSRNAPARCSRTIRGINCAARRARCSVPG
jgi:hypothetical protein